MPSMTASTACSIFHAPSRPFTGSSLRQSVASAAPVVRSVLVAARERRVIAALDELVLGAQPTRSTRSRPRSDLVEEQRRAELAFEVAAAQRLTRGRGRCGIELIAEGESSPPSYTPTTLQPVLYCSALPRVRQIPSIVTLPDVAQRRLQPPRSGARTRQGLRDRAPRRAPGLRCRVDVGVDVDFDEIDAVLDLLEIGAVEAAADQVGARTAVLITGSGASPIVSASVLPSTTG
jgi:hypothetical protein